MRQFRIVRHDGNGIPRQAGGVVRASNRAKAERKATDARRRYKATLPPGSSIWFTVEAA